jgi:hypothetical protein
MGKLLLNNPPPPPPPSSLTAKNNVLYSGDRQITAEEHADIFKRNFEKDIWKDRESLIKNFLFCNADYILAPIGFVANLINNKKYQSIVSLGAGQCVAEWFIKMSLYDTSTVVACDFDHFFISKAQLFFPEIIAERFDFFNDDLISLRERLNINFDLAVFFFSAYVMDDDKFIKLFSDLKFIGTKQVIDFYAGFIDFRQMVFHLFDPLRENPAIRQLFHKKPLPDERGWLHGYARSRSDLRKLYKKAGWHKIKEISIGECNYVAILE